ncbi:MAG: Crp/Fnr family transcriptional regulator [Burkholderiaceae bacterium]
MLHTTPLPSLSHPPVRAWMPAPAPDLPDVELLRSGFAPARLSGAVLRHLANAARLVRCPAGPFEVASPRRPEPSWWLLARGRMGLGMCSASGQFVEKRCIGPGEWLETAGAMSSPGTWLEQAWCHTPVELLAVPVQALGEACTMEPAFPAAFGTVLAQRVRELNDSLHDLVSADVTGRLARWLLRQVPAYEHDGVPTVVLTERKQALARHLGTTSESLSRALRRLSDDGLVSVKGYEITLRGTAGLQMLAFPAGAAPAAPRKEADR